MRSAAPRLLALAVLLSLPALAQSPVGKDAGPPSVTPSTSEARQARELVSRYLDLVKAKRWPEVKRLIHPATIKAIAERKQRLGREDHPLAAWFHDQRANLKAFKVVDARPTSTGAIVVEVTEDNWQVEEKGLAEAEPAAYLVGKKNGQLFVVDKKRGETFTADAVRLGYKGYFDRVPAAHEEED